jgi:hypothetical protein
MIKSSLNRWLPGLRQPPRRCPDARTRWSKGSPTRERTGRLNGRTIGIGPQIGFVIPISEGYQGYLNPSGYRDLAVEKAPQSRHDLVVQVD